MEYVPGPDGGHASDDESLPSSRSTDGILKSRPSSAKGSNYRKPTTGTRFMENRMGNKTASSAAGHKNKVGEIYNVFKKNN